MTAPTSVASVDEDDLIISGPLDEYAGTWIQDNADGLGIELQLELDGTGRVIEDGKSRDIFWKVDEEAFYVTLTVYDADNNIFEKYMTVHGGGLFNEASRVMFVRPEPDYLEIISYEKAQKMDRERFAGT